MNGITADTALWYASRAAGVVALLMLSLVIILGVLTNRQGRLPGLPRFAVVGLHRNVALLTVAFITLHVLSAVFDGYVDIGLIAILVPFTSRYEKGPSSTSGRHGSPDVVKPACDSDDHCMGARTL